ncbi:uncharacterized protein BKA55DRAFT_695028 [Fusarium redolens]|uniref:Uncharacterized protein n=1 Tax=Fusarium redolens TaxID=48865 RepID=A0A9P9GBT3_FUSRE|nr:uncharacterized protein BKA55DRAFT_695028 [Fusarium redolens]KAH7234847.1 hypothetical protein BKA55DRAFT_695028 [Fusarium redolens]
MKFSIVLAIAALSAETLACANIGQVCQKGDPDVCQCGAPLTLLCNRDLLPGRGGGECPHRWLDGQFSAFIRILLIQVVRLYHYQIGDICPLVKRGGVCVDGKCVRRPRHPPTPRPTPK